ncbi:MAG: LOG family protein [Candidatus Omnitrophota bacterium]
MIARTVTVFGSGSARQGSRAYRLAYALGHALAHKGFFVMTGGYGGVMEAAARGAKEAGGRTVAVVIRGSRARPNAWSREVIIKKTWHQRLLGLIEKTDACVVCDGATGTLTELFTAWEMTNKQLIAKPILLLGERIRKLVRRLRRDPEFLFPEQLVECATPAAAAEMLVKMFACPSKP